MAPTVVFDLDGTLADTAADIMATLNVLLAREGLPSVPREKARDLIGAGARALLARGFALAEVTLAPERLDRLYADFLVHYGDNMTVETTLFPGVEAALDRLATAGYRLAVCTNKVERHAIDLLAALGIAERFAAIAGRDTFPVAKPDPRHLTGAVRLAGGDPLRALLVGDSETDVATARAAGLPIIGVSFGYNPVPLTALGVERVIDHFDALDGHVRDVLPWP